MTTLAITPFSDNTMMRTQAKPAFRHDCKSCLFLGSSRGYDVYYCPSYGKNTTHSRSVLAKNSDADTYFSYKIDIFRHLMLDDEDERPRWLLAMMEVMNQALKHGKAVIDRHKLENRA